MTDSIEPFSFIYGMVTAFAECVSREAKGGALSPPFPREYYSAVAPEIENIVQENGISCWFEENKDLPEESRVLWFVLYKFPEVLEKYLDLRREGANPALHLEKFYSWLGYGCVWTEQYTLITPKFREQRKTGDTPGRILFPCGGWPPG